MDGVLEELMDEDGQGGCRVLGDDRPSEDKFKIPGEKTNVTIVIMNAPHLVLLGHIQNVKQQINANGVVMNAPIRAL